MKNWIRLLLTLALLLSVVISFTNHAAETPQSSATGKAKFNKANQKKFRSAIKRIAKKNRLESALLHAVISVESGYDPNAVSSAGAMGLMQLMPETAERFAVQDPFDPVKNIEAGARYLRLLLNKFGKINLALAAYHAGEGRVSRGRNTVPPILATRKYVVKVIHRYLRYKQLGF